MNNWWNTVLQYYIYNMFILIWIAATDRTIGIGPAALFSPKVLCWFSEMKVLIFDTGLGGRKNFGFQNYNFLVLI